MWGRGRGEAGGEGTEGGAGIAGMGEGREEERIWEGKREGGEREGEG